jgi:hypothetical protein
MKFVVAAPWCDVFVFVKDEACTPAGPMKSPDNGYLTPVSVESCLTLSEDKWKQKIFHRHVKATIVVDCCRLYDESALSHTPFPLRHLFWPC